ncbi:glycoside hydrolase family 9 protein [Actinoplanes sp. NPDC049118]|uniref:glycoside hydrolase family 9 protein n=1 Tax=Actinoplanes sp. NPDC049118 TaxID=3155769 RepID=UPI0033F75A87
MLRSQDTAAVLAALALIVNAHPGTARADGEFDQVTNGTFDTTAAPWVAYGTASGKLRAVDGQACVDTGTGSINPWDSMLALPYLRIQNGATYTLTFDARGTATVPVTVVFQQNSGGYSTVLGGARTMTPGMTTYTLTGTGKGDFADGQLAFQFGGKPDFTFCIDNVSLRGGDPVPPYEPDTGPRMRVNQVGYLPYGPKAATLVTTATTAVPWALNDAAGKVVRSGWSTARGVDPTSGQNVHTLDFSSYRRGGSGYTLTADGATSHPFPISGAAYRALRVDSKTFFYTQRSGTPILDTVAPGYARAAGHVGVAPNQGDDAVPCLPPAVFADHWTCPAGFTRDVTGGWYDAGDHGKYVVNGGIAVAQLMSEYERNRIAGGTDRRALRDGTLRVPERGNNVPDILDEARWELDFLLRMQVPGGRPLAGMAYHKISDTTWTGLPLAPAADAKARALHRPSTAATLNLAAAAAQGARLFRRFDRAYAGRLLTAARTAYAAAEANPALYASNADGTGGGAYADGDAADEFYWAAAELYLTTGERAYRADVLGSPLHTADVFDPDGFHWGSTAALGRLDLATVDSDLPRRRAVRASVVAAADALIALQLDQAYGQPYAPADDRWAWGSNGAILNNMVVIGTAYDLTGRSRYREAVLTAADFLFGRNALNISYVTGYGTVYARNQHTRMYAHQLDPSLPHPPAGTVAGGPNSGLQDPLSGVRLAGCVAQFCYLDDINAYSTNEIAVNWNSGLSWVSSFLADQKNG